MSDDYLNYEKLVEDALRTVVREALKGVSSQGVPAGHHLYISFRTQADGVQISENLRTQFPDEMTIVLENQFWDLKVDDDQFRVTLNFNKVPQELVVPLSAISRFADQRANFGLQFGRNASVDRSQEMVGSATSDRIDLDPQMTEQDENNSGRKVVALDAFRKN